MSSPARRRGARRRAYLRGRSRPAPQSGPPVQAVEPGDGDAAPPRFVRERRLRARPRPASDGPLLRREREARLGPRSGTLLAEEMGKLLGRPVARQNIAGFETGLRPTVPDD